MTGLNPVDDVRARYAAAAERVAQGDAAIDPFAGVDTCAGSAHYDVDAGDDLPVEASFGCGNPVAVADLHEGETVLDLGSGAGLDVLLSARRVGSTGRAIGLDMTGEMLDLARRHAAEAGATNVEFLEGRIEDILLPDASVDVVISNCVIVLSADKQRVFGEVFRVLRPGGRMGISDIVADTTPTAGGRVAGDETGDQDAGSGAAAAASLAGAITADDYAAVLSASGFTEVDIQITREAGEGIKAAIVRAVKPDRSGATAAP